MSLNKYKDFLDKKIKPNMQNDVGEKRKYLPFFNPKTSLMQSGQSVIAVRVLPMPGYSNFFIQYLKHGFKIENSWKYVICSNTETKDGKKLAHSCPICNFVNDYKEELDKDVVYKLSPKNSYTFLIYNPVTKQLEKFETNDYGISDVITALTAIEEEFDPDKDGFKLFFSNDSNGYPKAVKAEISKKSVEEFKKEFLGGNDLPDVYGEIIPSQMQYISKLQNSILDLAINFFAPTYAKEVSNEEITDSDIVKNDSFPELDSVFGKEEMTTTKTTFVPDDDTITSEETDELVNFLNSKE